MECAIRVPNRDKRGEYKLTKQQLSNYDHANHSLQALNFLQTKQEKKTIAS